MRDWFETSGESLVCENRVNDENSRSIKLLRKLEKTWGEIFRRASLLNRQIDDSIELKQNGSYSVHGLFWSFREYIHKTCNSLN